MTPAYKVLCIEDDAEIADLISEILNDAGFEAKVACDGLQGLEKLEYRPDIVICDVEMPGISGFEVLRRIRDNSSSARDVPFLLVTAYGMGENQIRAFRLGCEHYIIKPVDFDLLIEIIRRQLSRRFASTSTSAGFRLTEREAEVLTLVARGKSSADIAALTKLSDRTVNFHIENIMRKAGVGSRAQAAVLCTKLGFIDP